MICFGWCGRSVEKLALSSDHTISEWCFIFIDHHSVSLSWSCWKEKPSFSKHLIFTQISSPKLWVCQFNLYLLSPVPYTIMPTAKLTYIERCWEHMHKTHSPYATLPVGYKHASQMSCSKLIKLPYEQQSPCIIFQPILSEKITSLSKQKNSQTGQKKLT